jgi:hypothetical protein
MVVVVVAEHCQYCQYWMPEQVEVAAYPYSLEEVGVCLHQ